VLASERNREVLFDDMLLPGIGELSTLFVEFSESTAREIITFLEIPSLTAQLSTARQ